MNIKELNAMSQTEMQDVLVKTRHELHRLRMLSGAGQLKANHTIRDTRKTVARILTLLAARRGATA